MKDKIIWITGASSGIGEALVYAYDALGAKLIISSRNTTQLLKVKERCTHPLDVHILPLDLEATDTLSSKAEEATTIYGTVDMLINSGGISQRGLAMETNLATEQRLMAVNFWGTVTLSKAILPIMLAKNSGHIVCVSSLVGKFGTPLRSAYSASKHALHGYFDSLRAELPNTINISIICPGFIKTNVTYNALTANGDAQGTMDDAQENGMLAAVCAQKIITALEANKLEAYIGGKETFGVLLKRFLPRVFARVIRKAKVV